MNKTAKIFIAGHRGMVGSAIVRVLYQQGYSNLLMRSHDELDLTNQQAVQDFFEQEKPDYVVLAAGKVGGIWANENYPAEFIYTNMMIEANVIHQAYKAGVQQLLFLGSSCIYPKFAEQPMQEEALLTGELEPTNEPYAIAKIAGIKLCESYNRQYGTDFRSVMPTNLYGPNDNYDLQNSHVIPALIRKIHRAKIDQTNSLEIWGSGSAKREFLYVGDLADACVMLMGMTKTDYLKGSTERCSHINIGTGTDVSIKELVELIQNIVGYRGDIVWDTSKPDGTPKKLLNVGKLEKLGWVASIELKTGLERTYQDYLAML
ncbi:MAG: GDP-fucose synthetase [Cycloclasticus sp. symbiont of Bathymodiolus heckerae]|nr:MAG: GDP-fucose synthetase [Cycloclasticus sp. symbiont of Bathymodiolus heckerae]